MSEATDARDAIEAQRAAGVGRGFRWRGTIRGISKPRSNNFYSRGEFVLDKRVRRA